MNALLCSSGRNKLNRQSLNKKTIKLGPADQNLTMDGEAGKPGRGSVRCPGPTDQRTSISWKAITAKNNNKLVRYRYR